MIYFLILNSLMSLFFIFHLFLRYDWHDIVSFTCVMYWFDICMCCKMITTASPVTSVTIWLFFLKMALNIVQVSGLAEPGSARGRWIHVGYLTPTLSYLIFTTATWDWYYSWYTGSETGSERLRWGHTAGRL